MNKLIPFSAPAVAGDVSADFKLESDGTASITFQWNPEWPLKVVEQMGSSKPERHHELWKSTCFEAFIQPQNQKQYWEINLSPGNLWNVYEFTDYRQPQPPVEAKKWELLQMKFAPGELLATIKCDCNNAQKFKVGLTCILEMKSGEKSYWALKHAKAKPDYHDDQSFSLERSIP